MSDDLEWREWRRAGVGGSDIAALIGLSRYASPTSLFYEKIGALDDDREDSPRQRIGKRMEAVLAAEFHDETGLYVAGEQTWCQHPEFDWARCTLDGAGFDHDGVRPVFDQSHLFDAALGTVEFKTDGRFGWPDGIPANIRAQTIWQMGVTNLRHCWLVVMFAGFRVEVFEIGWDADAESDWVFMLDVAHRFWNEHILTGNPPPVDDHPATTETLTNIYQAEPGAMIDADGDARQLVSTLQFAKRQTKAAEAEEDRLSNELRVLLGNKTDLIDGWTTPGPRSKKPPAPIVLASWREQIKAHVDLDSLRPVLGRLCDLLGAPDLVEAHTKRSPIRVLRVSKTKETS